jgi:protein-disulfide isomerase
MRLKLKWIAYPTLYFFLFSIPAHSTNATDPSGQILGGSLDAPVRIEVFSDFECPACREYYLRTIKKILKEYSTENKVCVIYHEFPLRSHRYSLKAALYSEAAYRLGRQQLLQLFDAFYMHQAEWSDDGNLEEFAAKVLKPDDYQAIKKLVDDPGTKSAVDHEIELASKMDIRSTPTSFIYYPGKEKKVEGLLTYLILKTFIDKIVH